MGVNVTIPKFNLRELASKIKQLGSAAFRNVGTQDNDLATVQYVNQGRKNIVYNGGFDVWQRGTSGFSSGSGTPVVADGWRAYSTGTAVTLQRANPSYNTNRYCMNCTGVAGNTSLQYIHRVESLNMNKILGKDVTISGKIYNTSLLDTFYISLRRANATDDFTSSTQVHITPALDLPKGWSDFKYTFKSIDSSLATGMAITIAFGAVTSGNIAISEIQLEQGSIATPFEYRPIGEELALCQRYYQRLTPNGLSYFSSGAAYSTTACYSIVNLPITMRANPSVTVGNSAQFNVVTQGVSHVTSGVTTNVSTPSNVTLNFTTTGLVAGDGALVRFDGTSTNFVDFSAEL